MATNKISEIRIVCKFPAVRFRQPFGQEVRTEDRGRPSTTWKWFSWAPEGGEKDFWPRSGHLGKPKGQECLRYGQGSCPKSMFMLFFNSLKTTIGSKKTNKQKTHKHFSDGPCGTIVPGTNPHPSQGQTGQNGDFTVELNRERPVCPRDGSHFVPGRGPICPRDGSCLSRTPSRPIRIIIRGVPSQGMYGSWIRIRLVPKPVLDT